SKLTEEFTPWMCEEISRGFEHVIQLRAHNTREPGNRDEQLRISRDPTSLQVRAQNVKRGQHRERDHKAVRGDRKPADMQKGNHGQPVYSSARAVNSRIAFSSTSDAC